MAGLGPPEPLVREARSEGTRRERIEGRLTALPAMEGHQKYLKSHFQIYKKDYIITSICRNVSTYPGLKTHSQLMLMTIVLMKHN